VGAHRQQHRRRIVVESFDYGSGSGPCPLGVATEESHRAMDVFSSLTDMNQARRPEKAGDRDLDRLTRKIG
jgi:hypothetical protein